MTRYLVAPAAAALMLASAGAAEAQGPFGPWGGVGRPGVSVGIQIGGRPFQGGGYGYRPSYYGGNQFAPRVGYAPNFGYGYGRSGFAASQTTSFSQSYSQSFSQSTNVQYGNAFGGGFGGGYGGGFGGGYPVYNGGGYRDY